MENFGVFLVFLRAFVDELWLTKKKKEEGQNGDFCSKISQLHERLGKLRGYVAAQYTSEADLLESLWLDCASHFARALPIPYVQAAILNLLNPYIRSCYRTP